MITNQHVVDGAQSVKVTFWNGKTYDATVVGTDPSTDVAVLDVDAPASVLEPLSFTDSSKLEVGDGVVAIGSPFGLEQTVTSGIVSALHRQITAPNDFAIDDAIQTDAAINHGNSGGPLLDMTGRVVGVTSQIESESGGNDGVGFAVSSNTVKRIAAALISDGSVAHAYLGVATEDSTSPVGAAITAVRSGTPAAEANLATGDVVTAVDGEHVSSADALRELVDAHKPGDSVTLTIKRNGDTQIVARGARDAPERLTSLSSLLGAPAAMHLRESDDSKEHSDEEEVEDRSRRRRRPRGRGAGAAVAADRLTPKAESQAIVNDAAKQLGVDPAKLSDALEQALKNRIDAAVDEGRLTQEQGDAMKRRITSAAFPLFIGPGFDRDRGVAAPRLPPSLGRDLDAAASFLGLNESELRAALASGKSLAEVAQDEGKSVDELVDALVAARRSGSMRRWRTAI